VFGSVARGQDRPDSDVDLLADLPPGMGLLGLGRVQAELEAILGSPVDLVPAGDLEPGSDDSPDGGSGSDGMRNLGHLVHHLEQVSELIGGGIGADFDRIVDARGLPGRGIEPTRRSHADPFQFDSQRRRFPVDIVEDAAGCCEMEQMPAGEIGFHRDAAWGPPVREADDSVGGGHHCSGTHRDLEAIVHQRFLPKLSRSAAQPDG